MNCSEFRKLSTQGAELDSDTQLRAQWELHLISCADCAEAFAASEPLASAAAESFQQTIVARTSAQRDEVDHRLQQLRETQPPPEFLAGVLRQTIGVHNTKSVGSRPASRHWAFVQSIMLRPRIALEASFALTCCWVLIFGAPTELAISTANAEEQLQQPLATSRRKIEEFQQDIAVLLRAAQPEDRQGEKQ